MDKRIDPLLALLLMPQAPPIAKDLDQLWRMLQLKRGSRR